MTVLGIDVGGTKLAAGVVDADGRVLAREQTPTEAGKGPAHVLDRIVRLGRVLLSRREVLASDIRRVGIGCAGPVDRRAGLVFNPPNLPGWVRVPLVDHVARALGLSAVLDNDANAAALGESRYGAGRGAESMVYITVSTGIGGGVVLNGRLWHGLGDGAGEVGHMTLEPGGPLCGCGNRGCLEALASGTAIARRARALLAAGRQSRLRDMPAFTAAEVVALAAAGDALAREVWEGAVGWLALGVGALITILAPERIIIGGGVAKAGTLLFEPLRRQVRERVKLVQAEKVQILPTALGDDVGVLGAAALALQE